MPSPTPSISTPSASSAKPLTPTPNVASAGAASTSVAPTLGPTGPRSPEGPPVGEVLPTNNGVQSLPVFSTVGRESGPALSSKVLGFIIIIKAAKGGTLHAVMNPKAGPGVLATFEDVEQAVNATTGIPACKINEFFIIPVGGE